MAAGLLLVVSASARADTLGLGLGVPRVLELGSPVTRIVIGTAGIVDATVQNESSVQLIGLHAGNTSLTIFTDADTKGEIYGLIVGSAAWRRTGPAGASVGGALAQAMAGQADMQNLQVHTLGTHVLLSGTVPDLQTHENAIALAGAYGGGDVVDQTSVSGDQMVAVEIRFAAISTTTVNELGFNFQSLGSGFQGFTSSPNSLSLNASTLSSMGRAASAVATSGLPIAGAFNLLLQSSRGGVLGILSALSSAGLTQLLAQPTLVVRSGEHASFLAGGEVPIPVPQGGVGSGSTITIEYHSYGVRLDVAPTVLSNHRISLQVAPEVSEIDNTNALSLNGFTVPAFRKRSTSTTVELGDGESFVIAGLIYNNNAVTESRVPLLGDIPILGAFFKLTSNSRERQELIVIATPHLVHPLATGALPPLPGEEISHYNPGTAAELLNRSSLSQAFAAYGLMP